METIKDLIDKALVNLIEAGELWSDLKEDEWDQVNNAWDLPQDFDTLINQIMTWKENI
jgi:hypothetical protein